MAQLKAVIVPAKVLKGGKHKIRISLSHNGKTRYILTDIIIDKTTQFSGGFIVNRHDASYLNTKLRGLIQKYQNALDELETSSSLSCEELVYAIVKGVENKNRTLESIFTEYIECARIKKSTKGMYKVCWNAIKKAIPGETIVNNITRANIVEVDKVFQKNKLKNSTHKNYMVFLKALLSYADECGYVSFRVNPFRGFKMPQTEVRNSWITVEQIKAIRDCTPIGKSMHITRDIFMLSYYLGGINIVDLWKINFNNLDRIKYIRTKIENKADEYIQFDIPEEAKEIIMKYRNKDGFIRPAKITNVRSLQDYYSKTILKKLGKMLGIDNLIYYSARKSFSQHALELGIREKVIDYIIGHKIYGKGNSLYHYVYVTPEMASEAIRKVLDNLK